MIARRQAIFLAAVALVAVAIPFLLPPQGYLMRVAVLALLFAAMAQAWNIVGGLANQISLGHAGFFGIGAYTSTILLVQLGWSPWLGMLCGATLAAAAGALLSLPTMRLKGHYFALATLAFGEVMRIIANSWTALTGGPVGISVPFSQPSWALLQFKSAVPYYFVMLAALCIITGVFVAIRRSRLGYRLRAIKANPDAAEVIGVDTVATKITAAVISAALIGACGTLYAQFTFFFDPDTVFDIVGISVKVALICIVGGIGTAAGPIVGALFIIPAEDFLNNLLSGQAAGVSQFAYGAVLILVILIEPRGILSLAARLRRLLGGRSRA